MVTLLLFVAAPPALGQDDGRVSCFVMGQVVQAPYNPFTSLFIQDPAFRFVLYPLPTSIEPDDKKKLDRVYYPRTAKTLVDSFEVIVYYDARMDHFTAKQFDDLEYAFREAGLASVTVHSVSWSIWENTVLYDLSPISEYDFRYHAIWRVRFRREREPVFLPFAGLGMESAFGGAHAILTAKEGTTIWADMVPQSAPWLVSWRPGGSSAGLQWVFGDKFDALWWGTTPGYRSNNPYSIDLATNLLFYSTDRPLISDIEARRRARHRLSTFQTRKLLVVAVQDWAENFGANTFSITEGMIELDIEAEKAALAYLDQDYAASISIMDEIDPMVSRLSEMAERLKDQALFWVYLSEWLIVTSVALVAGSTLHALMVKRKLYRSVRQTHVEVRRRA